MFHMHILTAFVCLTYDALILGYSSRMRVLTIGTTSVLGRHLTQALIEDGHQVEAAGRGAPLALDLTDTKVPDWVNEASFDAVVNLAGIFEADTVEQAQEMLLVNSHGPLLAARIAGKVGAKHFVNISTWYAGQPSSYRGNEAYPRTKELGDRLLASADAGPLTVTILRPTHVYDDEGDCRPNQPALYWLVDEALAGTPAVLPEPELPRDYLHIDDFVGAVKTVLDQRLDGIFTVTSPETHTFKHLAEAARLAVSSKGVQSPTSNGGAERALSDGDAGSPTSKNHRKACRAAGILGADRDSSLPDSPVPIPNFSTSIPIEVGLKRIIKAVAL